MARAARVSLFLLVLGGTCRVSNHWMSRLSQPTLADGVRILIIGDSHIQTTLDPSLIPGSQSVAMSAEPFMASYFKMIRILKANPGVSSMVLGFGPHNVAFFNDEKFSSPQFAAEMFSRYNSLVPWWTLGEVPVSVSEGIVGEARLRWTPNRLLLRNFFHSFAGRPTRAPPYLGAYRPQPEAELTEEDFSGVLQRQFTHPPSESACSDVQGRYLRKMVDEALNRGIRVLLVATPTHRRYRQSIPPELTAYYAGLWDELVQKPGVKGLDLSAMDLPDSAFRNYDHVAEPFAKPISEEVARHIQW